MKEKILFAIDLDGTLLADSQKNLIHPRSKKAVQRAIEEGHIVCLLTGRPRRSSIDIYNELGLDTVLANYNGAYINNPSDPEFIPEIKHLDLNEALYILGDKKIDEVKDNVAIEGPGWVKLEKRSKVLEQVFGLDSAKKFDVGTIDFHKIPLKPTSIIIDTKPNVDLDGLYDHLRRNYCDLASFSYWTKGKGLTPVFDITPIGAQKDAGVTLMARYYGINVDNVMSFGDGHNDIPMFKIAGVSVAMKNAGRNIKERATHVSDLTNEEGGVGAMIEKALDNYPALLEEAKLAKIKMKEK
ncbi:MAG: Cof-type HAD-IIB family hydrolase [Mycoplasma sp.]|nr:Cof-type HAD-IIB family hydrolase [Mycoplasma sp.]